MYSTTCANTHHGVTTFERNGMVQNVIYLKNGTWLFHEIKIKIKRTLNNDNYFKNYHFLVKVTFNYMWVGF